MLESLSRLSKALEGLFLFRLDSHETLPHQFERLAASQPAHPFVLYGDERYTYLQANEQINRHADAYKRLGLKKGDVVALFMGNRPEFYWHFLGLGKIGVVVSLINTHIAGESLAHAVRICHPKRIIVGSEVLSSFDAIADQIQDVAPGAVEVDVDPEAPVWIDLPIWQDRLKETSPRNPPETASHTLNDLCAYIYTSGTTGMPKAALIRHARFYRGGRVWGGVAWQLRKDDILYVTLPLYHSNAMLLATSAGITFGVTIALARKFSATRFWDDCRRFNATCFIYIGELCRYLMNAPPRPSDREHNIRAISGNGLRPDIWEDFQTRFGIERIAEFYGSTEGNVQTINRNSTPGSVGVMMLGQALARWDEERQDFLRDRKGRLIRCKSGQPGILLGKIRARAAFDGYKDKEATEQKILRNVFRQGDAWFNTGDLLRIDWKRNLYFVDRLGDTFRWKGENVSTFEVQEQISKWPPAREVNVYGVAIEGTEGRAGMASVVLEKDSGFDPGEFKKHVDSVLPTYARPLFVRVQEAMETTATLKLKKTELQKEGFDPSKGRDPLYFRHPDTDEYVVLSQELYAAVVTGRMRL